MQDSTLTATERLRRMGGICKHLNTTPRSDLTEDGLHDLLIMKLNDLLGEWAVKQHLKVKARKAARKPD